MSGAMLTSAATVLADDPRLDVRHRHVDASRCAWCSIAAGALRKTAKILAAPGEALVFARRHQDPQAWRRRARSLGDARVERLRATRTQLDLASGVRAPGASSRSTKCWWRRGRGCRGRCCRRASSTNGCCISRRNFLGDDAKPLATLARLTKLDAAPQFELLESQTVGPDLRLRLRPLKKTGEKK